MKKVKNKEPNAKSPDRLILKLASGNPVQAGQGIQFQPSGTRSPFLWRVYPSCGPGMPEAFILQQGRGAAFIIGKGPPGLSPDSGGDTGWNPDNKAGPPTGNVQTMNSLKSYNKVQQINKKQNSNFFQTLIFKIMKKQILILVLFVLATFAGVNNSYGQCTPDPLHPAAGVAYDYEVTLTNATGSTPVFDWYVTKDVNLLTAGSIVTPGADFAVGATAGFSTYHVSGATTSKIQLTWTSAAVASATPYYLVVKYTETSAAPACNVENMRVWMIDPLNTFLLVVAGSDVGGVITNNSICAANITGALVTAAASPTVEYTYGPNNLYYKVTASGAVGTWTPSISLPALTGSALGQVYATADWSPDNGTTWNTFGAITPAGGTFTTAILAPVSVVGTAIVIRVVVTNDNFETLTAQPITVGVDGVLPGGVNDIVDATTCTDAAAFAKTGVFTVNVRPTITDATTNAPNPTDFITKNP